MTEEDAPRATPTKKLFTNFKVYMHTWFPLKEEVENIINNTTETINETINDNINIIQNQLSKKADATDIPTYISELEDDKGILTQNDVKNNLSSIDTNMPLSANQGKELKTLNEKLIMVLSTLISYQKNINKNKKLKIITLQNSQVVLQNLIYQILNQELYHHMEYILVNQV